MATIQLLLTDDANRRALASLVEQRHTPITGTDLEGDPESADDLDAAAGPGLEVPDVTVDVPDRGTPLGPATGVGQ